MRRLTEKTGFLNRNRYAFYAYGIVFMILICVFAVLKIYPFGTTTVLKSDSYQSYAPWVLNFARDVMAGNDLEFSWNGGLGVANVAGFGYFVFPFGFLSYLFPPGGITEFVALLILLRIPLGAVSMFVYARRRFGVSDKVVLLFSVMYALSQFPVVYHWDYFWQELVIVVPLVALGIERMFEGKGWKLYCISLSYCILTSYAQGFNLSIFAVLYFLTLVTVRSDKDRHPGKAARALARKENFAVFKKFMLYSLIAGGMSMLFIVPQLISLPVLSNYGTEQAPAFGFQIGAFEYIIAHLWGNFATNLHYSDAPPNIYTGILPLFLAVLFFFARSIKGREKLAYGRLLFIFFLCFQITWLTFIMHGLHMPSMLPHRYSVIYSFIMMMMALKAFKHVGSISKKKLMVITGVFVVLMGILYAVNWQDKTEYVPGYFSLIALFVNIGLFIAYGLFLIKGWHLKAEGIKRGIARVAPVLLAVIVLAEIFGNTYIQFENMHGSDRDGFYNNKAEDMRELTEYFDSEEEFYRAEFKHPRNESEGRLYNYKSFNVFSVVPGSMTNLFARMGINSGQNIVRWSNPTPVMQAMFAQKYLLHESLLAKLITTYDYTMTVGGVFVHENPDVLPLGFMVHDNMLEWTSEEEENPFDNQDAMMGKAVGRRTNIFRPLLPEDFTYQDMEFEERESEDEGAAYFYDVPRTVDKGIVTLTYTAQDSKRTYMSISGHDVAFARVWVDGQIRLSQQGNRGVALDAGYIDAGAEIKVEIELGTKKPGRNSKEPRSGILNVYCSQMDYELFLQCIETLREETMHVTSYDNKSLTAEVTNEKKRVLFTSITWDPGWTIKVDGQEVTPLRLGGAFFGLELEPGEHIIEMEYSTRGILEGGVLTAVSVTALIVITVLDWKKKKKAERLGDGSPDEGAL